MFAIETPSYSRLVKSRTLQITRKKRELTVNQIRVSTLKVFQIFVMNVDWTPNFILQEDRIIKGAAKKDRCHFNKHREKSFQIDSSTIEKL